MDVSKLIEPKSDQLNYDDLIAGPMQGTIKSVDVKNTTEQPISIHLSSWHRPWKPCKSMARLMAAAWGKDSSAWVGQSVELFGDPNVMWAGVKIGGIRVAKMTGINKTMTISLTVSRGKRTPYTVHALSGSPAAPQQHQEAPTPQPQEAPQEPSSEDVNLYGNMLIESQSMDELGQAWGKIPGAVKVKLEDLKNQCKDALSNPDPEPLPENQSIEDF